MAKAKNPVREKINKSLVTHARDETTASQEYINLPPGIQGGIATLVDARLGVYQSGDNEGEQFMYLAGVVVEPVEHIYNPKIFINGKVETQEAVTIKVRGQRTSLMIPLCDTINSKEKTTSADEHVADLLNKLRQLGADTSDIQNEEGLKSLMKALVEVHPVFKFSTRALNPNAMYPTPTTWESWHGSEGLEDYESPDEDEVVDETEEDPEDEESEEGDENLEDDQQDDDEEDLQTLGSKADFEEEKNEETEVRTRLTGLAEDLNIDPDKVDPDGNPVFETWEAVATAIEKAQTGVEEENAAPPEVDEVWRFKPPKKRKFVDVLVTAVFPAKETATIKNLEDGKTLYKGISWDRLQAPEE